MENNSSLSIGIVTPRSRPKSPRVTFFIQIQKFGVFVVEAEKFIREGGDPKSTLWIPTLATSEAEAREIGETLIVKLGALK